MKQLKKIFLHVGPDKTGSTAIQYALDGNRELLEQHSYLYAEDRYHPLLASFFSNDPYRINLNNLLRDKLDIGKIRERDQAYIERLAAQIELSSAKYMILSYEGFTGLEEDELARLKSFLNQYADKLELIYYIRPPFSYAISAMSQRIRYGMPSWFIHPPVTEHRHRLEKLINVFGKASINTRSFSKRRMIDGDVVADFLIQVGLPRDLKKVMVLEGHRKNEGLSEEAILIGDEIITLLGEHVEAGIPFRDRFIPILSEIHGRKYHLSPLQKKVLAKATRADMKYIRDEFGHAVAKYDDAFISDLPALSPETARSLARILISQLVPDVELPRERKAASGEEKIIGRVKGSIRTVNAFPHEAGTGEHIEIHVAICNRSKKPWYGKVAPVNAAYHWHYASGGMHTLDGMRTLLPVEGVAAGETVEMVMSVCAPDSPGDYVLELTLVQEYFNWFEHIGFSSQKIPVKVY